MNIISILDKIEDFNNLVVESGFSRDLQGYIPSISSQNNNLVLLKDVTNNIVNYLKNIYDSDIPEDLKVILPESKTVPFTNHDHLIEFIKLKTDTTTAVQSYHSQLTSKLNNLNNQLSTNIKAISNIKAFLLPYTNNLEIKSESYATLSIIFSKDSFFRSFKNLSCSLLKWERAINLYQQLISSEKPEEIKLLSFQNGSLDIVTNLNIDIAINLTEVIKYAFIAFGGFLTYKSTIKPIIDTFNGNEKLIKLEEEREKEMLANIKSSVERELKIQHENKLKNDSTINTEAVAKKIDIIAKVITEHVINGNSVKLLAESDEADDIKNELKDKVSHVKKSYNILAASDLKLISDRYNIKNPKELES